MATTKDLFGTTPEEIAAMDDDALLAYFKPLILSEPTPVEQPATLEIPTELDEDCPIKQKKPRLSAKEKLAAKARELLSDVASL